MVKETVSSSATTAPPSCYAYLRVSTDQQDVDNQRHGILEYANAHGLAGLGSASVARPAMPKP